MGLPKPLMKAGEAGGAAEWPGVVLRRRCEGENAGRQEEKTK